MESEGSRIEGLKVPNGQNLGLTNRNYIKGILETDEFPNQNEVQYCPKFQGVNVADIRGEGGNAYPRRSCRRNNLSVVTTNCKKSAEAIVPREKNLGRAEQS